MRPGPGPFPWVTVEPDRLHWPDVTLVRPRPRTWRLNGQYAFEWTAAGRPRQRLQIEAGYEFDGASIPHAVEWYIPREHILEESLPHDFGYEHQGELPLGSHWYFDEDSRLWLASDHGWTRKDLDRLFARMLRLNPLVRPDQRRAAYLAVRLLGWRAWRRRHGASGT